LKAVLLDVGAGTVDFLLYGEDKTLENSVKMVLPSPQKVYAKKIREITNTRDPIFIDGYTIGGGSLTQAVKNHINRGLKVYMTSQAAYSIRNSLEEVRTMGVEIIEEKPQECVTVALDEVKLEVYESLLNQFNETLKDSDICAVSVKDHGAPPMDMSNREFRIKTFREIIGEDNSLNNFLYKEGQIPEYYYRMKSAAKAVIETLPDADVYVMDTSISALSGCLMDPQIQGREPAILVNVGNSHTTAAVVEDNRIKCFFEHHTSMLNKEKTQVMIQRLCDGNLTHESVYLDGGHGVVYSEEAPGFSNIQIIAITGPRRRLLNDVDFDYLYAAPGGDVMMTGTLGLLHILGFGEAK
jgi:uncharacterized protein (DUF1786 family)